MTVGNLGALRQTAGRAAAGLVVGGAVAATCWCRSAPRASATSTTVLPATVAYVLAYAVMNLGAFAVVTLVGRHRPANRLDDYRALGRTEPLTAFALAFALACLAGLPPGLLGLFAKVVGLPGAGRPGRRLAGRRDGGQRRDRARLLPGLGGLAVRPAPTRTAPARRRTASPWSDGLAIGITLGAALWLSVAPGLVLRSAERGVRERPGTSPGRGVRRRNAADPSRSSRAPPRQRRQDRRPARR